MVDLVTSGFRELVACLLSTLRTTYEVAGSSIDGNGYWETVTVRFTDDVVLSMRTCPPYKSITFTCGVSRHTLPRDRYRQGWSVDRVYDRVETMLKNERARHVKARMQKTIHNSSALISRLETDPAFRALYSFNHADFVRLHLCLDPGSGQTEATAKAELHSFVTVTGNEARLRHIASTLRQLFLPEPSGTRALTYGGCRR